MLKITAGVALEISTMLLYLAASAHAQCVSTLCLYIVVRVHKYSSLQLHEWLTYSITSYWHVQRKLQFSIRAVLMTPVSQKICSDTLSVYTAYHSSSKCWLKVTKTSGKTMKFACMCRQLVPRYKFSPSIHSSIHPSIHPSIKCWDFGPNGITQTGGCALGS